MRPGIRTATPSTVECDFLKAARTDPLLMPPVKIAPSPQKRRKGWRLVLRKACYWLLDRT